VIPRGGALAPPPQSVCFFGTYAYEHTVTQLLLQACRSAGIGVVECHRSLWEKTRHKGARFFGARSVMRLLIEYVGHALALARMRRRIAAVPLYLVGFNGQLDCLLLRLLLLGRAAPMVFAPLVTLTETLIDDRQVFRASSWRGAVIRWLDRVSLTAATRVVMDAEAHRRYVIDTFGLAPERVAVWYLGADTDVFRHAPLPARDGPLRVLFYGSFLRLHGVQTILEAAALVNDRRLQFVLLGDGPDHAASVATARETRLDRVEFQPWVPYEALGRIVADAEIGLGVFGTSAKTQMVIPNKVYQMAAVGRPIVTADTPAVREVFTHGETAWLCPPGDAAALADALRVLRDDRGLRQRLGRQAAMLMAERFNPTLQGQRLAEILAGAVHSG